MPFLEMYIGDAFTDRVRVDRLGTLNHAQAQNYYNALARELYRKHQPMTGYVTEPYFFVQVPSKMNEVRQFEKAA